MKKDDMDNLGIGFMLMIAASTGNLRRDVVKWSDGNYPNIGMNDIEKRNQDWFLYRIALQVQPLMKMANIGLGGKMIVMLLLSYFDTVTDILVALAYRDLDRLDVFISMLP